MKAARIDSMNIYFISLLREVYKGYIHLLDSFVGAVVIVAIDYMDWFNSLFNRGK